jgi:segregation and condensation protein A
MTMETNGDYRVNLDVFEGPMDLLLYLIRKNDLSITDIPVAFILEEYLKYLDTLKEMNIDVAGEFLLMAAELAYIKSRMLLPQEGQAEEEEEEDPRADLMRRLLEYQRYKEAAGVLSERPQLQRDVFVPFRSAMEEIGDAAEPQIELVKSDVYRLVDAFARILIRLPKERFHDVAVDRISVNERILQLVDKINKDSVLRVEDLFDKPLIRYNVVITFLALLEMSRLKMIKLIQPDYETSLLIKGIMEKIDRQDVLRLVKSESGTEGI